MIYLIVAVVALLGIVITGTYLMGRKDKTIDNYEDREKDRKRSERNYQKLKEKSKEELINTTKETFK